MLALYLWLKNWFAKEEGQDLIEYALLVVLVVLVVAIALPNVASAITSAFDAIITKLNTRPGVG